MVVTVFSNANPLSGVVACGVENMSEPFWWFRLQLLKYCNMYYLRRENDHSDWLAVGVVGCLEHGECRENSIVRLGGDVQS